VATHKAIDVARSDSSRKAREIKYSAERPAKISQWADISGLIDEVLTELDEDAREILIWHFFENRSQAEIAEEKGTSQPSVSRKIESAITTLRELLQKRGLLVASVSLGMLLLENTIQAAPAGLMKELGKMAMLGSSSSIATAGATSTTTATVGGVSKAGTVIASAKMKLTVAAVTAIAGAGGIVTYQQLTSKDEVPQSQFQVEAPRALPSKKKTDSNRSSVYTAKPDLKIQIDKKLADEVVPSTAKKNGGSTKADRRAYGYGGMRTRGGREREEAVKDSIDLSTPEATVKSFMKMAIMGDVESVLSCYLPEGEDYDDIRKIMSSDPSHPKYQMRALLEVLDPEAEMPIIHIEETSQGIKVVWQVTFKHDFMVDGQTFFAGDTMELDATLKRSGDKWLIDNF
jgi:hypothetical protein